MMRVRGPIIVYGFKHAGKTTLGRQLARLLRKKFVDLDEQIVRIAPRLGSKGRARDVRTIYREEGKKTFGALARKATRLALQAGQDIVLAGAHLETPVMREVREAPHRIFLDAPLRTILARIRRSGRPAFVPKEASLARAIAEEHRRRAPAYAQTCTLRTDGTESAEAIAKRLARPKICVPIQERTNAGVARTLRGLGSGADMAEIWADWLVQEPDVIAWALAARVPFIVVVKSRSHKGRWRAGSSARARLLAKAARDGASWIDVDVAEGKSISLLANELRGTCCGLIISHHDFAKTPTLVRLKDIVRRELALGADACKIATTVRNGQDLRALAELLVWFERIHAPKNKRIIVTGMGSAGVRARIAAPLLGAAWTYAARSARHRTARGQPTAARLRAAYALLEGDDG
jgi:3-dehydroquinate dehydratase type I